MDEYKWYKDDFETNYRPSQSDSQNEETKNNNQESSYKSESSSYEYQSNSYNASSGNSWHNDYANNNNHNSNFYNTNVRKKRKERKKRNISPLTTGVAIALTAVLSVSGAILVPHLFDDGVKIADNSNSSAPSSQISLIASNAADKGNKKVLTVPEIVDKVGPAVVGIVNKTTYANYGNIFGFYGTPQEQEVEKSSGSGVIISDDGYIVTNNHVIEGAQELVVILNTGDEYSAKIIGRDSNTDIAVIKIEAEELTHATMGESSALRVGETAIAIGNPLGQEFAGTTTQGIISGLNRNVTIDNKQLTLIQTDAAINPGNSGGALVNAYGEVVGINTAKISSSRLEGLGFAIPIDEAKPIIQDLVDNGYVTGRPVIGIGGRAVTKSDAEAYDLKVGVYVLSMTPNSPAYMAGIKIGDIIVECNGKKVETIDDINKIKNKFTPGDELSLKVYRQGDYKDITLILGEDIPSND